MSGAACERLRELAPELALGIADGEERAWALDHLAGCAGCRAHLERLAGLADELLTLGPEVEPPAGFERRVVDALAPPQRERRRPALLRRLAIPALAAAAAAALAGGVVWGALDEDRELAGEYREALAVAHGEYFTAAPLEAPGGGRVGYVYGYQGRASWVMAIVYRDVAPGRYALEAVTADGGRERIGKLVTNADGDGSTGAVLPFDLERVSEVHLLDRRGREVARSELGE